jgi:hypothetical protein
MVSRPGGDPRVLAGLRYGLLWLRRSTGCRFRIREFLDDAYRLGLL